MVPPTEVESRAKPPKPYNCQCSASEAVVGTGSLFALGARSTRCKMRYRVIVRWSLDCTVRNRTLCCTPFVNYSRSWSGLCTKLLWDHDTINSIFFFWERLLSIEQYYLDNIRAPGVPGIYIEISQTSYMGRFTCKFLFVSFMKYSPHFSRAN